MVFKRRDRRSVITIIRESIYPRTGWRRAVEYLGHRLKRLPDTPHRIALGFACGVFVSFTPFFGLHFLCAALLAWVVRGNILASALGTFIGNPLTFPFIATSALRIGAWVLGVDADMHRLWHGLKHGMAGLWHTFLSFFGLDTARWDAVYLFYSDIFMPYLVGGLIPGLLISAVFYFAGVPLVRAYQTRKAAKRQARAAQRAAAQSQKQSQEKGAV